MKIRSKLVSVTAVGIALWMLLGYILLVYLSVERKLEHADALVVLGGSADYKKRTETAADLWKAGVAPKVIVTNDGQHGGWDNATQRNPSFAERAVWNLKTDGVSDEAIEVSPEVVESTHDEAELISKLAKERNYGSIVLVTSGFHARRALWIFERIAKQRDRTIVYGIEFPKGDKVTYFKLFWWLYPENQLNIPLEIVKLFYYWSIY
jgi:uncharacterized SAM-binding protein YcdF (DUF218 family)